jgi:hypothetical protein
MHHVPWARSAAQSRTAPDLDLSQGPASHRIKRFQERYLILKIKQNLPCSWKCPKY